MTTEGGRDRLSEGDVVDLAQYVAGLSASGLALPPGLRALGEELPSGSMRRTLDSLAEALERGESLDEAMRTQGNRLPPHLQGVVKAGLRTGRLGEILGRFIAFQRVGADLKRATWMSLAYPLVLLACLIGLFTFVSWIVVEDFRRIFMDFGVNLPVITLVLLEVSGGITRAGWGMLLVPVLVVVVVCMGGPWRRRVVNRLPLIGPIWRWGALAEFAHLLALLLESEVPLPEALPLAAGGVGDADLTASCRRLAREIDAGGSLAEGLVRERIMPRGFARLLDWSRAHQSLPEALHMAGETFEARARTQATIVGIFITVVAVLLTIVGIGLIVLGLFLPLIQLLS
ncbi:MAG: type II secretion system F family protein, partial [Isosphaeraceae bacterium]